MGKPKAPSSAPTWAGCLNLSPKLHLLHCLPLCLEITLRGSSYRRWHHGPQLVDVDDGAVELDAELVEVPHSNLPEVAKVVLVEKRCGGDAYLQYFRGHQGASGACRSGHGRR
uniref:Uncharacterized protein n=1 Tax=Vitis vinifera TaxID=29760 RepID=F6HZV9_VITVI